MYSSQSASIRWSGTSARLPPLDPDSSGTQRWCHPWLTPLPRPASLGQTSLVATRGKTLLQTLGPQQCERWSLGHSVTEHVHRVTTDLARIGPYPQEQGGQGPVPTRSTLVTRPRAITSAARRPL